MSDSTAPDDTAVRVALWRALHVEADRPHVFEDTLGLELVNPDAGLDTFAQRRPELASRMVVFEIDRPGPRAWKRRRLVDRGIPAYERFVLVDFEAGDAWWEHLAAAGFDAALPAVVASTGVSMFLTRQAIESPHS